MDKIEAMRLIFSDSDLNRMLDLRDVFNPGGLCNPGKVIPSTKTCRYCGFGVEDFRHRRLAQHDDQKPESPAKPLDGYQ
jgi:hypothetical protein